MIKFGKDCLLENSIIEMCILPRFSLMTLLNNLRTDQNVMFIDSRGSLTALYKYQKKYGDITKKKSVQISSDIFRIFNLQDFLICCRELKKVKRKLCVFDSLPSLIDTLVDKKNVFLIYNSLWELIYFYEHTFIITNHYHVLKKYYAPRLGVLWISNVTYRILIKSKEQDLEYEIVQTPEKRIYV